MLEFLIKPRKAERKPVEMLLIGFFYAIISVLLATFLFYKSAALESYSSVFVVTFTTMLSLPFIYYLIRLEEKKEDKIKEEKILIKEHGKALTAMLFLFLGYILAFSLAFILMPPDMIHANFQAQLDAYCSINAGDLKNCAQITGHAIGLDFKSRLNAFSSILSNNFFVMLTILLFSFVFGAGAIFILAWNASVIGVAMGLFTKGSLANMPLSFLRYLIHGIPEIAAYFVTALAGGIISVSIIRHKLGKKEFWHTVQDSLDLIIVALIILILAAIIEVFFTPWMMSFFKI
jgi:uncharacterized membrane protein SpoIIM required for sporulation